jgi:hypothetical protein
VRGARGKSLPAELPAVRPQDHYGQARATDSAIVETLDAERRSHFEKFLFYRGVGNFELPIKLTALGGDRFEIVNNSDAASGALVLVRIDGPLVRFTRLDPLAPRATIETALPTAASTVHELAALTTTELVAAGLYEKEALAMVNTWRSSWFEEPGTRLFYLVPGKLTDELLPLSIEPAPQEIVRVLVGRLETITPEDCKKLVRTLAGECCEPPTPATVKAELASLGRFAEPAVQFVISQTADADTRTRLEAVLAQLRSGR